MSKVSVDSVGRIGRTATQAFVAAVAAAPVLIGAFGLTGAKAAAAEAVVAALVASVSAAQNIAEDFGFVPPWGKVDLPTTTGTVPSAVATDIAKAETVAGAAAAVEKAAKQ